MKIIYYLMLGTILFVSCSKQNEMDLINNQGEVGEEGELPQGFDVNTASTTFKVGDEVTFDFTGDPDQIQFYSGEVGKDYAFRDGRVIKTSEILASFSTNVNFGQQADLLSVWVSTDFTGNYTYNDVSDATWKNTVSKDFALAPQGQASSSAGDAVPSGTLNLISETEEGKPLYIGFRYKKKPDAEAGTQRNWFIRSLKVESSNSLENKDLFNGSAFTIVYDNNFPTEPNHADRNSSVASSGLITLRVPSTTPLKTLNTEVWAISPAINLEKIDLGPDNATIIKDLGSSKLNDYTHTYTAPGTYTATFIALNGTEEILKQITITITE